MVLDKDESFAFITELPISSNHFSPHFSSSKFLLVVLEYVELFTSLLLYVNSNFSMFPFWKIPFKITVQNPINYWTYVAFLLFNFFDIFMVTYFGNEIMYWSGRLSCCLYECNWMNQSKSCKMCVVILMEVLKQPEQLVIGKLYALDLDIFTKVRFWFLFRADSIWI